MRHAQRSAEQLTNHDRTKQNPAENLVGEVAAALVAPQMAKLQKTCFCAHFFSKSGSNKRRKERMSVMSKVKMVKWTFLCYGMFNQSGTNRIWWGSRALSEERFSFYTVTAGTNKKHNLWRHADWVSSIEHLEKNRITRSANQEKIEILLNTCEVLSD